MVWYILIEGEIEENESAFSVLALILTCGFIFQLLPVPCSKHTNTDEVKVSLHLKRAFNLNLLK